MSLTSSNDGAASFQPLQEARQSCCRMVTKQDMYVVAQHADLQDLGSFLLRHAP